MPRLFSVPFALFCMFLISVSLNAQWSSNPAANLAICDTAGEQTIPLIAGTTDGGCYISWFDNRNGSYAVYLQRLDRQGIKQWPGQGLLISDNPQNSSLVGYDLAVDKFGNAIVAFTDIRTGSMNVFAYCITPLAGFLWGSNGVNLSTTADFQANPKIQATSDGGVVFAWMLTGSPNKIAMQKLSAAGAPLWGASPKILASTLNRHFNYPAMIPSDSNSITLVYTEAAGNFPSQTIRIRSQKVTADGTPLWGTDGIYVQDIGKIGPVYMPGIISDGRYGSVIYWQDDRNSDQNWNSYVQMLKPDGSLVFPANGIEFCTNTAENNFYISCGFDTVSRSVYALFNNANSNQSAYGIKAQRVTQEGRKWGDQGVNIKALSSPNTLAYMSNYVNAFYGGMQAFYIEESSGYYVYAFSLDSNGAHRWPNGFITVSNSTTEKMKMAGIIDKYNDTKMTWVDDRGTGRDIYAQNVKFDGTLGYINPTWKCVNLNIPAYWSMVSVPVQAPNMRPENVFPGGTIWYPITVPINLSVGKGYWIRYNSPQQLQICGDQIQTGTIPISAGWNMIGVYDKNVAAANLTTTPAGILNSVYWGFNGQYYLPDSLLTGKGYWIRATESGQINLNLSAGSKQYVSLNKTLNEWARVTVTGADKASGILYLPPTNSTISPDLLSLPPVPPAGIFDVRFESGRAAENIMNSAQAIVISNAVYPVEIKVTGANLRLIDRATGGKLLNTKLIDGGRILISNSGISVLEITGETIPFEFKLAQNYPNPFNPETELDYQLGGKAKVDLKIFNVLGKEIVSLVNEIQPAGRYKVKWNAGNLCAGVYFCRLSADSHNAAIKMILLK